MILLNSTGTQSITLTLTEMSRGITSSFVLRFTNDMSQEVIVATCSNISTNTRRYDQFSVDLGTLDEGWYSYSAWENGYPDDILETGKGLVQITNEGLGTTHSTTYIKNDDIYIYEG